MAVLLLCVLHFHHKLRTTDFYLMVLNVNGGCDVFEKVNNIHSLIQKIFDIETKTVHCNELYYCNHFYHVQLSCPTLQEKPL